MRGPIFLALLCAVTSAVAEKTPIDRHALVSRHNIDWPSLEGQIPLGNGNFAFNADGTGLQTVGGNSMSHWCWHSFPLPDGVSKNDVNPWATTDSGRLKNGGTTPLPQPLRDWQRDNPHPLNLGRIGFVDKDGSRLGASDVRMISRRLDLWTGLLTSTFKYLGETVTVETCVDPKIDAVSARVKSPLLRDARLQVLLDFPAPDLNSPKWVGNFDQPDGHTTKIEQNAGTKLDLTRIIDDTRYHVALSGKGFTIEQPNFPQPKILSARYGADPNWVDVTRQVAEAASAGRPVTANNSLADDPAKGSLKLLEIKYRLGTKDLSATVPENSSFQTPAANSPHRFMLKPDAEEMEFTCAFSEKSPKAPSFEEVRTANATAWPTFWNSGGAIDLSQSRDPRWKELERRIVLSQYQLAAQSAGDQPPAEVGLTGTDPWRAKWHFEMLWWHLAHYSLWNRREMSEKALGIYSRILPVARAIAENFGYKGLMWPKSTGPDGFNDGFPPEMALLWKQPHPIFFAELDYRANPTPKTLEKWEDIVQGTAEFMADYPVKNSTTGYLDLDPCWPASEGQKEPLRRNTIFELGYWRVALEMAQQWRLRLGLSRDKHWDDVLKNLAPLPEKDGLYIFTEERTDTFTTRTFDHVDNIGIAGMLPPFPGLDPEKAKHTVEEVGRKWNWDATWGWDFPWMAMAAARVGDPKLAIDALLNPSIKNHYDERGLNTGGPGPYLPGNGGLLYAVAMMAAGWDGAPDHHAPGFPDDGSWTARWENLKPAP
jgi:hypothetical protein